MANTLFFIAFLFVVCISQPVFSIEVESPFYLAKGKYDRINLKGQSDIGNGEELFYAIIKKARTGIGEEGIKYTGLVKTPYDYVCTKEKSLEAAIKIVKKAHESIKKDRPSDHRSRLAYEFKADKEKAESGKYLVNIIYEFDHPGFKCKLYKAKIPNSRCRQTETKAILDVTSALKKHFKKEGLCDEPYSKRMKAKIISKLKNRSSKKNESGMILVLIGSKKKWTRGKLKKMWDLDIKRTDAIKIYRGKCHVKNFIKRSVKKIAIASGFKVDRKVKKFIREFRNDKVSCDLAKQYLDKILHPERSTPEPRTVTPPPQPRVSSGSPPGRARPLTRVTGVRKSGNKLIVNLRHAAIVKVLNAAGVSRDKQSITVSASGRDKTALKEKVKKKCKKTLKDKLGLKINIKISEIYNYPNSFGTGATTATGIRVRTNNPQRGDGGTWKMEARCKFGSSATYKTTLLKSPPPGRPATRGTGRPRPSDKPVTPATPSAKKQAKKKISPVSTPPPGVSTVPPAKSRGARPLGPGVKEPKIVKSGNTWKITISVENLVHYYKEIRKTSKYIDKLAYTFSHDYNYCRDYQYCENYGRKDHIKEYLTYLLKQKGIDRFKITKFSSDYNFFPFFFGNRLFGELPSGWWQSRTNCYTEPKMQLVVIQNQKKAKPHIKTAATVTIQVNPPIKNLVKKDGKLFVKVDKDKYKSFIKRMPEKWMHMWGFSDLPTRDGGTKEKAIELAKENCKKRFTHMLLNSYAQKLAKKHGIPFKSVRHEKVNYLMDKILAKKPDAKKYTKTIQASINCYTKPSWILETIKYKNPSLPYIADLVIEKSIIRTTPTPPTPATPSTGSSGSSYTIKKSKFLAFVNAQKDLQSRVWGDQITNTGMDEESARSDLNCGKSVLEAMYRKFIEKEKNRSVKKITFTQPSPACRAISDYRQTNCTSFKKGGRTKYKCTSKCYSEVQDIKAMLKSKPENFLKVNVTYGPRTTRTRGTTSTPPAGSPQPRIAGVTRSRDTLKIRLTFEQLKKYTGFPQQVSGFATTKEAARKACKEKIYKTYIEKAFKSIALKSSFGAFQLIADSLALEKVSYSLLRSSFTSTVIGGVERRRGGYTQYCALVNPGRGKLAVKATLKKKSSGTGMSTDLPLDREIDCFNTSNSMGNSRHIYQDPAGVWSTLSGKDSFFMFNRANVAYVTKQQLRKLSNHNPLHIPLNKYKEALDKHIEEVKKHTDCKGRLKAECQNYIGHLEVLLVPTILGSPTIACMSPPVAGFAVKCQALEKLALKVKKRYNGRVSGPSNYYCFKFPAGPGKGRFKDGKPYVVIKTNYLDFVPEAILKSTKPQEPDVKCTGPILETSDVLSIKTRNSSRKAKFLKSHKLIKARVKEVYIKKLKELRKRPRHHSGNIRLLKKSKCGKLFPDVR